MGGNVISFFGPGSGSTLERREINGEPGVVVYRQGAVAAVIAITHKAGAITRIYVVADPRKLERVKKALAS